jgi:hypothetical protein
MNDTCLPGAKEHIELLWIAYFDLIPRHRMQPHQGKELLLIKPLTFPILFTVVGLYDIIIQFDKRRLTTQVQELVFL